MENVPGGQVMAIKLSWLSYTLLCEPAGKSKRFLADQPGVGGCTELCKWRRLKVL